MAPSALSTFFLCSCVFLLLCPNLYGQYLPAYNIAPRWVLPVLLWLTHLPFIFFFAFVIFFPLLTVVSHLPASGSRSVSLSSASNFTPHPQELNLTHTRLSWQNTAAFLPSSTTSLMGKGDSITLTGAHLCVRYLMKIGRFEFFIIFTLACCLCRCYSGLVSFQKWGHQLPCLHLHFSYAWNMITPTPLDQSTEKMSGDII